MAACAQTPAQTSDTALFGPIVTLQATRVSQRVTLADAAGPQGSATLTNLNPAINAAFLLALQPDERQGARHYHLENPDPARQRMALEASAPGQLVMRFSGSPVKCVLWPGEMLAQAQRARLAFAPLCGGKLYLRNAVPGNRSTLEATTEFLRDHVWFGEQIIGFVRRGFYRDAFVEHAQPAPGLTGQGAQSAANDTPPSTPQPAQLTPGKGSSAIRVASLGIEVVRRGELMPGQWVGAAGLDRVYVSVVQPGLVAISATPKVASARALDPVEADALALLVAFDLAAFEVGYALGTEHPRLGWSPRVREGVRDPTRPGPDGVATAVPLVRTGMVSPVLQPRVVATFTGGFKREHGAFRYGALAAANHGSHYGFVEQGVVYSTLVPGLSTLYVLNDSSIGMKTWTLADQVLLGQMRHARQNGVPLVERDPAGGASVIGPLVDAWGPGNWSGSADEKLRSLRAGACLATHAGRSFLIYGYFSTATPRAMAHVFKAYGCTYAMHLDMNALEHTYLALYPRSGAHVGIEHLVSGMAALDKNIDTTVVPRFLGFADGRDFFYLMTRKGAR